MDGAAGAPYGPATCSERTPSVPVRTALTALAAAVVLVPAAAASAEPRDVGDACAPGLPAAPFDDVAPTATHARGVDCVVHWDVTQGTAPRRYAPTGTVTRAQMAAFVSRVVLRTGGQLAPGEDAFDDDDGTTHEAAINALAAAGVVTGTGPRTYSPAVAVTRDQMATFLVRAYRTRAGTPLPDGPDAFDDDAGNRHEANIDRAAAAGLAGGTAPRTYLPRGTVRRDQMATFLSRLLDRLVEDGHGSPPPAPPSFAPGALGTATVGMTATEVAQRLTAAGLHRTEDSTGPYCRSQTWTGPGGDVGVLLSVDDGRVFVLGTGSYWGSTDPRTRAARGVGVGSSEAQLRAAYPEAQARQLDVMHGDPGRAWVVSDGTGRALVLFVDGTGSVDTVSAMTASTLEMAEYCS